MALTSINVKLCKVIRITFWGSFFLKYLVVIVFFPIFVALVGRVISEYRQTYF